MRKSNRISLRIQIRSVKNAFFQIGALPFKNLLPDSLIQAIHQSGNPCSTVFTPLLTLKAFIFQVLSPTGSCKEAVAHILMERINFDYSANSMNTGAYCKARLRLLLSHLKAAVTSSGQMLHQQASIAWLWKGYRVVLVDGTTLLMPDTEDNQKVYPQQNAQKPGIGFPIVRLVGLVSLATGSCIDYVVGPYQGKGTGETSLFSRLINILNQNDLLLADRYYTSFAIIALLIKQGTPLVFRQRSTVISDFRRGQRLGAKDHIIHLIKPKKKPVWMSEEDFAELPDVIPVREFSVKGVVYITTLLNAKAHPKKALAELYQQRWKIELDIRTIKTHMGMEMLRCQTAKMVEKEIAVNLLAYNLIRANTARGASIKDKEPRYLSFMATVQLMRTTVGLCMTRTGKALGELIYPLLMAMTETEVGKRIRPNQPRVIKRRPKGYPLMTKPREEYVMG
jgi:hypothetical protein